jgi:hypothetical protein
MDSLMIPIEAVGLNGTGQSGPRQSLPCVTWSLGYNISFFRLEFQEATAFE